VKPVGDQLAKSLIYLEDVAREIERFLSFDLASQRPPKLG